MNPGDVGHMWCASRYVFSHGPWVPFLETKSKRTFVNCPSTFLDNPHSDQQVYKDQLESSCPTAPELLRAWLEGDWAIARGAFFGGVLEESRNAIDPWPALPRFDAERDFAHLLPAKRAAIVNNSWHFYLSHDYGSAAPSVTYLCAESPGTEAFGKYYPRGSVVLVDELATNVPGQPNNGLGWTVPVLADAIKNLCGHWNVKAEGVGDDSMLSFHGSRAGSIATEFKRQGVYFSTARKGDRLSGWERMRRMLQEAGSPDRPGLYLSRRCSYFWETVPYLGRDQKRPQDVDTQAADHGADAARYALTYDRPYEATIKLFGT